MRTSDSFFRNNFHSAFKLSRDSRTSTCRHKELSPATRFHFLHVLSKKNNNASVLYLCTLYVDRDSCLHLLHDHENYKRITLKRLTLLLQSSTEIFLATMSLVKARYCNSPFVVFNESIISLFLVVNRNAFNQSEYQFI